MSFCKNDNKKLLVSSSIYLTHIWHLNYNVFKIFAFWSYYHVESISKVWYNSMKDVGISAYISLSTPDLKIIKFL